MKQEILTESEGLDLTQPPIALNEKDSKETDDLFSSLPNSFLCDREKSTACAPYEPTDDGTFYASTRFLYETILNEEPGNICDGGENFHEKNGNVIVENENGVDNLSADTETLFSKFDTLTDCTISTLEVLGEPSTLQKLDINPLPAKRRCVVSETAPDIPPDAEDSQTPSINIPSTPPPPLPADYPAPRLSLSRRFSSLYEKNGSHVDVSSLKLPKVLTIRQEHDLLSAVWDVLYK